jgi:glutamate carboxypeptidase
MLGATLRTTAAGFVLAASLAHVALAAPTDPAERKMVATIASEHDRNLALLEKMVRVNSGSMNFKGVEEVGRIVRAELEPLGFEVRWVPMAQVDRAGHIVATHKGNGRGKRILLIGHLDTGLRAGQPLPGLDPQGRYRRGAWRQRHEGRRRHHDRRTSGHAGGGHAERRRHHRGHDRRRGEAGDAAFR